MSDYSPKFKPGQDPTLTAAADITGGQLVYLSGANAVTPTAAATAAWLGVARQDAKSGEKVVITRGGVQFLVASGGIAAGARVIPAASGRIATVAADATVVVGTALTAATNAGDVVTVAMDR